MRDDLLTLPPERDLSVDELLRRKRHLISEARATLVAQPSRPTERARLGRRRYRPVALTVALASAVVLTATALGVVRDIASFFAGWHDPEAPVPTAPDVVIASGTAGVPWTIVATRSDRGLCMALVLTSARDKSGLGSCGYSDIRGDLPPDLRGDPSTRCLATPTRLVPCGSLPRHWIGPVGSGAGSAELDQTFAFGPLAAEVASVELILDDGEAVRAHVVRRPRGINAPLNFYWASWPCGPSNCVDARGPQVKMAIARDEAGRVLERRVPGWNGNPTGDPKGASSGTA